MVNKIRLANRSEGGKEKDKEGQKGKEKEGKEQKGDQDGGEEAEGEGDGQANGKEEIKRKRRKLGLQKKGLKRL
jgi:hypothetical protein